MTFIETRNTLQEDYHIDHTNVFRMGHVGEIKQDGSVEIRYSIHLKNIREKLEFAKFLQENGIRYTEINLGKIEEELIKTQNSITDILEMIS